jgi:hypothetical protein
MTDTDRIPSVKRRRPPMTGLLVASAILVAVVTALPSAPGARTVEHQRVGTIAARTEPITLIAGAEAETLTAATTSKTGGLGSGTVPIGDADAGSAFGTTTVPAAAIAYLLFRGRSRSQRYSSPPRAPPVLLPA